MQTWILGGPIITPDQTVQEAAVILEDGRILAIVPEREAVERPPGADLLDTGGLLIVPGLIDLHVHGGAGSDTMDATPEALRRMSRFFAEQGVTSYLPTTISQSPQAIQKAIDNLVQNGQETGGAQILGVHLEGPYLSPSYHGAQPVEWLRIPDPSEYRPWYESGIVRLMTIAPELPGSLDCIREGVSRGVRFSAGHTAADYAQVQAAAEAGLSQATHTFNGMPSLHHREPGPVGAALVDDRIFTEVIADGVHLHPAVVQLIVNTKGVDRTILVTDAMRAAGLEDGEYDLGSQIVSVREGVARTQAGGLAGSTLTLNRAVRNAMRFSGLSINQAIALATTSPAAALGISGQKGAIQPGAEADIIIVDPDFNVHATLVRGTLVYQSSNFQTRM